MVDFLATAETWLATIEQGALATSDTLTYRRSGETDIDLTGQGVCIARHTDAIDTGEVVALDVESIEYLIPYDLIDFGAGPVEPIAGDRMIHVFRSGNTATFEASAYAGTPVWRWHDRDNRTVYRVQMTQVSVA